MASGKAGTSERRALVTAAASQVPFGLNATCENPVPGSNAGPGLPVAASHVFTAPSSSHVVTRREPSGLNATRMMVNCPGPNFTPGGVCAIV